MSEHIPERPHWRCRGCGDPWPCETAKRQLLAEYDEAPTALRVG